MKIKIFKKLIKGITILLTFQAVNSFAQTQQGPKPQWILEEWASVGWDLTTPVSQEQSGDEWYYNHTKIYENGVHVGYVACG